MVLGKIKASNTHSVSRAASSMEITKLIFSMILLAFKYENQFLSLSIT